MSNTPTASGEKTKICPQCGKQIPAAAKKCPECQSDLRNWLNRHPILSVLGILIIIGFTVSAMSGDSSHSSTSANADSGSSAAVADQLQVNSFKLTKEYGYDIGEGTVTNISSESLSDVDAVMTLTDADGNFVKSDEALIEYNPILPGQTSPFKVMSTDNPAIKNGTVEFKFLIGGTIPTRVATSSKQ